MRRQQNREIEKRAAKAAAAKERTNDALTVQQLGGSEFKILNFLCYAPGCPRQVIVEASAGIEAEYPDADYTAKGAKIALLAQCLMLLVASA